jgi:hypothetical protein
MLFSLNLQAQKSFQIDSVQISNANQNYIYASECKSAKQQLYAQINRYEILTEIQELEIKALNENLADMDRLYQNEKKVSKNALKQAKRDKRRAFVNGALIGGGIIIVAEAVALIFIFR